MLAPRVRSPWLFVLALALAACRERQPAAPAPARTPPPASDSATAQSFYAVPFSRKPTVAEMTEVGRKLFFDPGLSASGTMSCATCHDPRFAYGPPNARSVQPGGLDGQKAGVRAVPSLRYLSTLPPFGEHHFEEGGDESVDQGPTGGHTWDGRADTTHDQARMPLTSPFEMANPDMPSVVAKVAGSANAAEVKRVFGDDVFADGRRGETAVLQSLEIFQQSPKDFYPYSSRFDAWLRHKGTLSAAEERGLALFNDPVKGNCASCHPSQVRQGAFPVFTDFGFQSLGVPRNREIPANADPRFHDLGLCGPQRRDLADRAEYCGAFRVPTLRNVARRRAFFHNGVFHDLRRVVAFYVERDSNPARWYGRAVPYDDLPPAYRKNVNRDPPFGGKRGSRAGLTDAEINDLIAFLNALTDADQPRTLSPAAP